MTTPPATVVIGAGPAGLVTVKALTDHNIPVTCYETTNQVGGLWIYGAPDSPTYRTLHLNTSRTRTQFADHPMPEHWPDYPDHTHIADYLQHYAEHFGLLDHIHFNHHVHQVTRNPDRTWTIHTTGPDGPHTTTAHNVVVANGHNRVPKPPTPAPEGTSTAEQIHSHAYRGPEQLTDRRVLIVGAGNSAMDIAVDASHTATRTLLSMRRGVWIVPKHLFGRPADTLNGALARHLPWRLRQHISQTMLTAAVGNPSRYGLPAPTHGFLQDHPTLSDTLLSRITHGRVEPRPAIAALDGNTVTFTDGRHDDIDLIIWCTGYQVDIPFLDPQLLGGNPETLPLYRHIFHLDDPTLAFVGLMQSTGAALPLVEAQAKLVAAHLAGDYTLPEPDKQRATCRAELRAATARWGQRRPAMRVDFDIYLAQLRRELHTRHRTHRPTTTPAAQRASQ